MKQLSVMLKPASSLCNMRCEYCFYSDISDIRQVRSYGIMSRETADSVIRNILQDLEPGDMLSVVFQGGEPTVAGLDFYRHFAQETLRQASGVRVDWAFQTNGLLLDDDWCEFFLQYKFLVGLSLDLEDHDKNRLDAEGAGTKTAVLRAKKLLEKYQVDYNILCVLTNGLARHPQKVWNAVLGLDIAYIQFIPCLDEFDADKPSLYAIQPERFAGFYNTLISLWYKELQKGRYISVKLIDDLVNLLATGRPNACGMLGRCSPQFVVEADGGVYPCDFYVLDDHRFGSFCEEGLRALFQKSMKSPFFNEKRKQPDICKNCPYWQMCGGGCKRVMGALRNETACGYREVLKEHLPLLKKLAASTQRGR